MPDKKTFCSLPFTGIFLGPDGGIKPCCSSVESWGNLHDTAIDQILNSSKATSLRQAIINGNWHSSCRQCMNQEMQGATSERCGNLEQFQTSNPVIDSNFFKLERLDLRWSNTCNLACTYCYEYFSSKWAQIKGIKVNTLKDEHENSLFLLIEQHKESVNSILLLGGEPLLQKENLRLIDILPSHGFSVLSNLAVNLETNAVAQKLLDSPAVKWNVSFETVGDRYEYVRHNASWELFKQNLNYLHSRGIYNISSHSLYSIYSAFNLIEFYDFILEYQFQEVHWHILESSGENANASVVNLSPELKDRAYKEIEYIEKHYATAPGVDQLKSIKEMLLTSKKHTNKFLNEISSVENQLTKTILFENLWPELYKELVNENVNSR